MGLQDRERLDEVVIHPDGTRWGQFKVTDIELCSIPPNNVQAEVMKAADRLGLEWSKLSVLRSSDEHSQIVYGRMKADVQQPDEIAASNVSNRRYIDLSILE
jgi:hypothetical protein